MSDTLERGVIPIATGLDRPAARGSRRSLGAVTDAHPGLQQGVTPPSWGCMYRMPAESFGTATRRASSTVELPRTTVSFDLQPGFRPGDSML